MAKLRPAKCVGSMSVHKLGKSKVTFQKVHSLTNLLKIGFAVPKLYAQTRKTSEKEKYTALQMLFQTIQNSK